jgi:hypothetical protein
VGSDIVPKNPGTVLYDALDSIQSALKDVLTFWETHVAFLKLLVNRQSNFPLPGDETKVTVELWTAYQNAILRSSSSISESIDALDVDPVIPLAPRRTWRKGANVTELNVASGNLQNPMKVTNESEDRVSNHMSFSNRLGGFLYRLF